MKAYADDITSRVSSLSSYSDDATPRPEARTREPAGEILA